MAGALAALGDEAHLRETKRMVDEGRAYLQEQFAEMRIPFVPAVANFVMVNVGDGCAVFEELLRRKIIVRPLKGYGLPEWVRISVGTMEENKKLIAALREVIRCAIGRDAVLRLRRAQRAVPARIPCHRGWQPERLSYNLGCQTYDRC